MSSWRRALNHVRALRRVAPGLKGRNPTVWLPLSVTTLSGVRRRRAREVPSAVRDGVAARRVLAPAAGDRAVADVYVYEAGRAAEPTPALFWIHGGGLIMGAPELDHALASGFADDLGIVVVSPRYRLAPEHPFPAAIDDVYAGFRWLLDHADDLGVDPARIAVGGGSAGGGLAAALVQRAHDDGLPVAYQVLVEPMLDDRTVPRAEAADVAALAWTVASNRFGWASYLGHEPGEPDDRPYAVPARRADLSGLPPAYIGIGDADLFLDECLDYAARLRAAGVPVDLDVVEGMHHAGEAFPSVPLIVDMLVDRNDYLAAALGLAEPD